MRRACLALLILLVSAPAARAHEVLHTVERGKAVAVKAYFADGEVLAYREYQIFSPSDARIPYQKGRTDRSGYIAFMPDVPGAWRVVVTDDTGHGLDTKVEVAAPGAVRPEDKSTAVSSWAFALRPIIGAGAIAVIFVVLLFAYRKKRSGK